MVLSLPPPERLKQGLFSPYRDPVPAHLVAQDADTLFVHTPQHLLCTPRLPDCRYLPLSAWALPFPCCRHLCTRKQPLANERWRVDGSVSQLPRCPPPKVKWLMCVPQCPQNPRQDWALVSPVAIGLRHTLYWPLSSPYLTSPLPTWAPSVSRQITYLHLNLSQGQLLEEPKSR